MKYLKECLVKILAKKKGGKVLDLGCGDGKLSRFFLDKGFEVTCVDKSSRVTRKLKKILKKAEVKKAELEKLNLKKKYDVIIAKNVLHLIDKEEANKLIKKMKDYTKKGGLNLVIGLTLKDPFYNKKKFFLEKANIRKLYKGWNFLFLKNFTEVEAHGSVPLHRHNILMCLVQKQTG